MNKILLIFFFILKKYSLLRIFQIIEIKKIIIKGKCLEFGAYENFRKNFLYIANKKKIKIYLTNLTKSKKIVSSDLKKKLKFKSNFFDNILIFNVLEHLDKYDLAFKELRRILKKGGLLIGSTPFLYQVHGAPDDYFRFTKTFFEKKFSINGYKIVVLKCLGQGPFLASFSLIYSYIKFIPILSHLVLIICSTLDFIIQIFVETNLKEIYPVGIFFIVKKI